MASVGKAQADGPMRRKPVTADRSVADPAALRPPGTPLWQLSRNPFRLFLVHSDCQCCIRVAIP